MPLLLNSRCIDLALTRPAKADVKIESTDQQFLAVSANYSRSVNDRFGHSAEVRFKAVLAPRYKIISDGC